ncbi:hypothetical protein ACE193_16100 [Bernardetia sp. OM2101]|uniref:hypothetical protein n=1 Tax=Bernardetia sp. OM2101 TaxID=3344876 RepID=UPI0035CFC929
MKKILHPLIPLFILLILGGKYVHDVFWIDKYDEKQLVLLEQTKADTDRLSNLFAHTADKSIHSADACFSEMGNFDRFFYKVLIDKSDSLRSIHSRYLKKINKPVYELENKIKSSHKAEKAKIYNKYFSIEELEIQTLFQEYVQEISKIDTLLAQKYQNYTFQNGQSNKKLTEKYLKGKTIETLIHLARVKAELAYINFVSIIILAEEYGYFKCSDKSINNIFFPTIHKSEKGNYDVFMVEVAPFMDSTRKSIATKEHFQTNVKYHINEKGFFIIDEGNFDIKDLQFKWFPDINHNDNHKRIYLEYGIDRTQYEK